MPQKHPAHALIAVIMLILLSACGSPSTAANNGTPAAVFTLPAVGEFSGTPIATFTDEQLTASAGTPSTISGAVCELTKAEGDETNFVEGVPLKANIAPANADGDPLVISGSVYLMTDVGCLPLAAAIIDVWQADANGQYGNCADFLYRGKVETDGEGKYSFTTIQPGAYDNRPSHISIRITQPNAATFITQLYFEGDANLNGMTHQDDPRILYRIEENDGYSAHFDFVLAGS